MTEHAKTWPCRLRNTSPPPRKHSVAFYRHRETGPRCSFKSNPTRTNLVITHKEEPTRPCPRGLDGALREEARLRQPLSQPLLHRYPASCGPGRPGCTRGAEGPRGGRAAAPLAATEPLRPRRGHSPPRKVPRTRHFFLCRLRKLQSDRSILRARHGRPSPPCVGGRGGGSGPRRSPRRPRPRCLPARPPGNSARAPSGRHGGGRGGVDGAGLPHGQRGGEPGRTDGVGPFRVPALTLPRAVSVRRLRRRWKPGRCPSAACWCTTARRSGRVGTR